MSLSGCQTTNISSSYPSAKSKAKTVKKRVNLRSKGCRIQGKLRGLNSRLIGRLCALSRRYGMVTVTSGCRKHGNKAAPKSFHRTAVGCMAADVKIAGVSKYTIAKWHRRTYSSGGTGTYRCSNTHIDVRKIKVFWHKTHCGKKRR